MKKIKRMSLAGHISHDQFRDLPHYFDDVTIILNGVGPYVDERCERSYLIFSDEPIFIEYHATFDRGENKFNAFVNIQTTEDNPCLEDICLALKNFGLKEIVGRRW